jgi:hypothetical protein
VKEDLYVPEYFRGEITTDLNEDLFRCRDNFEFLNERRERQSNTGGTISVILYTSRNG